MNAAKFHGGFVQRKFHQIAPFKGIAHNEMRLVDQALARHGSGQQCVTIVGQQIPVYRYPQFTFSAERPVLAILHGRQGIAQAVVLRQLADRTRYAAVIQVAWGRAHFHAAVTQLPGLQRAVIQPSDSNRQVPVAGDQIQLGIAEPQFHHRKPGPRACRATAELGEGTSCLRVSSTRARGTPDSADGCGGCCRPGAGSEGLFRTGHEDQDFSIPV